MKDQLGTLRKDLMQSASFRMLLDNAMEFYPKSRPFNPYEADAEKQINEWKSKSSEKAGFDLLFKQMTGITPEEYKK